MNNLEYAVSLRLIADFFEAHPEIEVPGDASRMSYFTATGKKKMAEVAKALGTCKKEYNDNYFMLSKLFGEITFTAYDYRVNICEPVVIGKKRIEEQYIPARPSEVIPAHEVDIIQWKCKDPLLDEAEPESQIEIPEPAAASDLNDVL